MASPSSSAARSATLPKSQGSPAILPRKRTKAKTLPNSAKIEDTTATNAWEMQRINTTLKNLNISFKSCTFTYKPSHFQASQQTGCESTKKKPSKIGRLKAKVRSTIVKIDEALGLAESEYKSCLFVPPQNKEEVQDFVRKNFKDVPIMFDCCKFIQRESRIHEKIARRLRKLFGIIFELTYGTGAVVVEDYTFRLKDIAVITLYAQERIAEKG